MKLRVTNGLRAWAPLVLAVVPGCGDDDPAAPAGGGNTYVVDQDNSRVQKFK